MYLSAEFCEYLKKDTHSFTPAECVTRLKELNEAREAINKLIDDACAPLQKKLSSESQAKDIKEDRALVLNATNNAKRMLVNDFRDIMKNVFAKISSWKSDKSQALLDWIVEFTNQKTTEVQNTAILFIFDFIKDDEKRMVSVLEYLNGYIKAVKAKCIQVITKNLPNIIVLIGKPNYDEAVKNTQELLFQEIKKIIENIK